MHATMSEMGRILVVDDEPQIRRVLRVALIREGYEVWDARRGDEALDLIRTEKFDLILLDINLPDTTGIEVCRAIRSGFGSKIIVLTVRGSESDKVAALDAGANDYVTKPFDTSELLARIRAHLRRHKAMTGDVFACDAFVVDFSARTVTRQNRKTHLSPKQCQVLRYLLENRDRSLSHRALLTAIWGPHYGEERMLLQAIIMQLRRKIEPDPKRPRYIVTIPWVGYRFDS
jgi:two-component system, OmpR family, KDP operon response regulator KdpE